MSAAQATSVIDSGAFSEAVMTVTGTPANNNLVSIGGYDFKFVAALGAAAAFTQVLVGGSAAASFDSLVKAINGTSAPAEWVESSPSFSLSVLAQEGGAIFLFVADTRGGTPVVGVPPNVALSTTIVGDKWSLTNMNTGPGGIAGYRQQRSGSITVTAAMITLGSVDVWLPFVPTLAEVSAVAVATGAPRYSTDTYFMASAGGFFGPAVGGRFAIVFSGGVAPAYQVGDTITYTVYGATAA
jgi:hypothetical protein